MGMDALGCQSLAVLLLSLVALVLAIKSGPLEIDIDCPSSDDLRPIRRFEKGGSGSSGVRV
jgi:hypothetical protein